MKTKTSMIIFLLFMSINISNANPSEPAQNQESLEIALDAESCIEEQSGNNLNHLPSITTTLKELGIDALEMGSAALIVGALATIIHEWGHGIAMKSLFTTNKEPEYHIGTNNPDRDASLLWFSIRNTHFYKKFPWFGGQTQAILSCDKDKIHKNVSLMLASGGASAALFLYITLNMIMAYCSHCDGKTVTELLKTSSLDALSPFTTILQTKNLSFHQKRFLVNLTLGICVSLIYNLVYGTLPLMPGDGMQIWEEHFGFSGKSLLVLQGSTIIGYIGSQGYLGICFAKARVALEKQRVVPIDEKQSQETGTSIA